MRTVDGTTGVWLTEYTWIGPKELAELDGGRLVTDLTYSNHDMSTSGWTKVGVAHITIDLIQGDELISSKVGALSAKKLRVLADAEREATAIEGEIQKLLAITYTQEV